MISVKNKYSLKNKLLISGAAVGLFFLMIAAGIASNWTSQQIDNWTFNNSDSTQSVRLKTVAAGVIINTSSVNAPDTAVYWAADTVLVRDTLSLTGHYSNRFKFTVSGTPADTFRVIVVSAWKRDSATIYPGGYYSSDYLTPANQATIILHNIKVVGTTSYQFESQGR